MKITIIASDHRMIANLVHDFRSDTLLAFITKKGTGATGAAWGQQNVFSEN